MSESGAVDQRADGQRDLMEVVQRVIAFTIAMDLERDYWERAPAMTGVMAWGDEQAIAVVRSWLDRAVETQTSVGNLSYCDPLELSAGHVARFTPTATLPSSFGYPLLELYERTGEARYLTAAERQAEALMATPRTSDGGFWARREGPELWIDFTYMMCPFLARFGVLTDSPRHVDEAFRQLKVHARHLVDPLKHLARHAWVEVPDSYPQSTLWSRGNGWVVAAAVDLLRICPDHEAAPAVVDLVRRILGAMAAYQDGSGFFRHVLDDPGAKFEASGTLMFAYGAGRAVVQGLVGEELLEPAVRAVRVTAGLVDRAGAVREVAVPPGGPGVPFGVAAFGQGFFLLACDALRGQLGLPPSATTSAI